MTATVAVRESSTLSTDNSTIRAFQEVSVPEAELTELRRRINNTKWPERETVTDATQGVQLATIQALARYWGTEYDWRKCEARLHALPQFITEIDGLDIRAPQGRPLCGLGTAEALFRRGSRGLQIAAVGFVTREEEMRHA